PGGRASGRRGQARHEGPRGLGRGARELVAPRGRGLPAVRRLPDEDRPHDPGVRPRAGVTGITIRDDDWAGRDTEVTSYQNTVFAGVDLLDWDNLGYVFAG